MAATENKPLHPFPLTIGKYAAELLDKDGFDVICIQETFAHSQRETDVTRDISEHESAATTLHTFVSYNCHDRLVDALDTLLKAFPYHEGSAINYAKGALELVKHHRAIATAALYEPFGEVAQ